jgi:hypothetical protein
MGVMVSAGVAGPAWSDVGARGEAWARGVTEASGHPHKPLETVGDGPARQVGSPLALTLSPVRHMRNFQGVMRRNVLR